MLRVCTRVLESGGKVIEAEAEAEANRILEESLTDRVMKNRFYETWDGALPKVVGDANVLMELMEEN